MDDKPTPDSYWVKTPQFLAGGYPALRYDEFASRRRLAAFLEAGFDTFIDLTCAGERPSYLPLLQEQAGRYGRLVQHQRFSFPDFDIPSAAAMQAALNAIDEALRDGHKVYLHCVGGIGRTGTTVGCWLIRHGWKPQDALLHLQELYRTAEQSIFWPRTPESEQQVEFILNWQEHGLA